jgi:hypothetical protein
MTGSITLTEERRKRICHDLRGLAQQSRYYQFIGQALNIEQIADDLATDQPSEWCEWTEDDDGNWGTACGKTWVYEAGTPKENGHKYCPACGKPMHEGGTDERA